MARPTGMTTAWNLILVFLVFACAVVTPLLGTRGFVLLLIACTLPMMLLRTQPRRMRAALLLTILGSCIAASSGGAALVQMGADVAYQDRTVFGWVALGCAALAAAAGPAIMPRPAIAVHILLVGGAVGGIAMSLFHINTFYVVALPLWWAAALLICLKPVNADRVA